MVATGAMAGLATDADFRETGGVLSGFSIIATFDGGTVAVSTSGVPVLQMAGPEERGIRGYGLIGLQVKPALATGFASAGPLLTLRGDSRGSMRTTGMRGSTAPSPDA